MILTSIRTLALIFALAVGLLAVAQPRETGAYWKLQESWTPESTRSDIFEATALDSSIGIDHLAIGENLQPVANNPGVRLTLSPNTRLDGYLEVYSISASLVKDAAGTTPATTTENTLFADTSINIVTTTASDCSNAASQPNAWTIDGGGVGNFDNGSAVVTKTQAPNVVVATPAAPGSSVTVCPVVRPGTALNSTTARRDFLLAHAGRQIRFEISAGFRTSDTATWRTPVAIPPVVYTVGAPTVGARSDGLSCQRIWYRYGKFMWGWPNSATDATATTPAIDRWEIMRDDPTNGWQPFVDSNNQSNGNVLSFDGDRRQTNSRWSNGLRSSWVYPRGGWLGGTSPWVGFMIRGYLYPSDDTRYINSEVITFVRRNGNRWECGHNNNQPDQPNNETGDNAPGPHGL